MPRYSSSVLTDIDVLEVLALEKGCCQYDLEKSLGKDYHTVLRHVKVLERERLIKLEREEPSERGGKQRKIYTITISGLFLPLASREDLWKEIDKIAKNHTDLLPLVFGKWNFFKEKGIKDEVVKRLRFSFLTETVLLGGIKSRLEAFGQIERISIQEAKEIAQKFLEGSREFEELLLKDFKEEITNRVIFGLPPHLWIPNEGYKFSEFLRILNDDPDLRLYIKEFFDREIEKYSTYLDSFKLWKTWWVSLREAK